MSPDIFAEIINQLLPEPHASLLVGMLFGVKTTMPPEFYQALRVTGTLHIIALSGMNISIIIYVIGSIFSIFGRRISSLLTIFFIIFFVWFVGPSANVVRAAIMGSLTLIGMAFGRQGVSLLSLFLTGILMLTIWPAWIFDIGFQLSFFATLGIILLGGEGTFAKVAAVDEGASQKHFFKKIGEIGLIKRIRQWQLYKILNTRFHILDGIFAVFWLDLRTTLAAQIFTIPIIFYHFGQLSLISPITNALVGWVVQPITVLGLVLALMSWLYLPLGQVMIIFLWPLLEYFIVMVNLTAQLPLASLTF